MTWSFANRNLHATHVITSPNVWNPAPSSDSAQFRWKRKVPRVRNANRSDLYYNSCFHTWKIRVCKIIENPSDWSFICSRIFRMSKWVNIWNIQGTPKVFEALKFYESKVRGVGVFKLENFRYLEISRFQVLEASKSNKFEDFNYPPPRRISRIPIAFQIDRD